MEACLSKSSKNDLPLPCVTFIFSHTYFFAVTLKSLLNCGSFINHQYGVCVHNEWTVQSFKTPIM